MRWEEHNQARGVLPLRRYIVYCALKKISEWCLAGRWIMAKPTSSDIAVLEKSHMLIKALTSKIASFPYDDPRKKAKDQHLLASGHDFVAKHLETDRINTLIAKHEEQYPPNTISCPICLEDVKVLSMYSAQYYICCGKSVCFPCD